MCFRTETSCIPRRNRGLGKLYVNFVPQKVIPHENAQCTNFTLPDRRNSRYWFKFSNLEPGAGPKLAHAYYVFML